MHNNSKAAHELVELAKRIVRNNSADIDDIRRICVLRFDIEDANNAIFLPFRVIDSDLDEFPSGSSRKNYPSELLSRLDSDRDEYLTRAMNDIVNACHDIIIKYSSF